MISTIKRQRQGFNFINEESARFLKKHSEGSVRELIRAFASYIGADTRIRSGGFQGKRPTEDAAIHKTNVMDSIVSAIESCNAECDQHGIGPLVTGILDRTELSEDVEGILNVFMKEENV